MKIDLHAIQSFGPNCLNRDDTNAPKDCYFGGYKRARLSSQTQKRAERLFIKEGGLVPAGNLSVRTRLLAVELTAKLAESGKDREESSKVVDNALKTMIKKGAKKDGTTEYLIFIGNANVARLEDLCRTHWDLLLEGPVERKNEAFVDFENILAENKAIDLALFGRMLADLPVGRVDAACQVAHAISTNKVETEFDYFTAVDDLLGPEETGASMIGNIEFNDPCYYRYASLDTEQLLHNLQSDEEMLNRAVDAYLKAFAFAIPTGKQNTFAAHNPPSFVLAVVRNGMPWNLANAFVEPIGAYNGGVIQNSVKALLSYWDELVTVYGNQATVASPWIAVGIQAEGDFGLSSKRVDDFDTLTSTVAAAL